MQVSDIVLLGGSGIGPSLAGRLEDAEAHNRSVLKERRITPGALTCFAVAECWGWRLGLVGGGGSAGSVLRSQGTLGPAKLSRYRAKGIRMSTFLCLLRPDPAAARSTLPNPLCEHRRQGRSPALKYMGSLSPVLQWRSAGAGAWGLWAVGAPRDRSCARRERWDRLSFRAAARGGSGCRRSYARSGPIPLPLRGGAGRLEDAEAHNRCVLKERRITPGALTCFAVAECRGWRLGLVGGGGSAGSVLRSQGTLGPAKLSRCRARGIRMSTFLCSLRPGPAAVSWRRRGVLMVQTERL
jgi:hypothetical protein